MSANKIKILPLDSFREPYTVSTLLSLNNHSLNSVHCIERQVHFLQFRTCSTLLFHENPHIFKVSVSLTFFLMIKWREDAKEDRKGRHLFRSGHAVRRCVEYTVDPFTHFIEGRIVSNVTL